MQRIRKMRWVVLALLLALVPASAFAGVFISVNFGPPPMPVYVQPPCPEPNMMWTPGHWAWDPEIGDYYWVPGAWVPAPYMGALWTPGYWGWDGGVYLWHEGYWGPHVGYYGGVNYGGGYQGIGYAGGEWNGGMFAYNTAVINVDRRRVNNVYVNQTIVNQTTIINNNHVAYAGGPGGIQHQPLPEERMAERDQHERPTGIQQQHIVAARGDRSNFSKVNGGAPRAVVSARPLAAETHAAPAGFRPSAARPVSELSHAQAPASIQRAAQQDTQKTAVAVRNNPSARTGTQPVTNNRQGGAQPTTVTRPGAQSVTNSARPGVQQSNPTQRIAGPTTTVQTLRPAATTGQTARPTYAPSTTPNARQTTSPTQTSRPTASQTTAPTARPNAAPVQTSRPAAAQPTTQRPSAAPTSRPSAAPSTRPSTSAQPAARPSAAPAAHAAPAAQPRQQSKPDKKEPK
jgi:hypothetical protein